jgi:hypothetical protein
MRGDGVNCEALQGAMRAGRELTMVESAHLEDCEACFDVSLTLALDAKPEVEIPADFAARFAAGLPVKRQSVARKPRQWGLMASVLLATVVVCAMSIAEPQAAYGRIGLVFLLLVASEIAGIALWLGPKGTGL